MARCVSDPGLALANALGQALGKARGQALGQARGQALGTARGHAVLAGEPCSVTGVSGGVDAVCQVWPPVV